MGRKRKIPKSYLGRPWYKGDISSDSDNNSSVHIPRQVPRMDIYPNESDPPSDPVSSQSSNESELTIRNQSTSPLSSTGTTVVEPETLHGFHDSDNAMSSGSDSDRYTDVNKSHKSSSDSDDSENNFLRDPDNLSVVDGSEQDGNVPDLPVVDDSGDVLDLPVVDDSGNDGDVHDLPVGVDSGNDDDVPDLRGGDDSENDGDVPDLPVGDNSENEGDFEGQNQNEGNTDSSMSDSIDAPIEKSYFQLLEELSKDWLMVELSHDTSKVATNLFWKVACKKMHELFEAKKRQNVLRKTPQFEQLRKKLDEKIPEIKMEMGYINNETKELTVLEDLHETPVKMFPPSQYRKAYEIATINVRISSFKIVFFFKKLSQCLHL